MGDTKSRNVEFHSVGHSSISDSMFEAFIGDESFECNEPFIGDAVPYYMRQFAKFASTGNKFAISWNWFSALYPFCWLFYRKMYLFGIIAFFVIMVTHIIIFMKHGVTNSLIMLFFWLLPFGICGNYLYYKHATKKLANLKEPTQETARKLGGISWGSVWIFLPLMAVTMIIYGILRHFVFP